LFAGLGKLGGECLVPVCAGFLVDLVAGAIGAEAGDAALGLEKRKLGLAELFFDFA